MKKQTVTLIATLLIALPGISQTSSDTTCLPNDQLKKAINRIEVCKVIESELNESKNLIVLQSERLKNKDSVIAKQKEQSESLKALVGNLEQNRDNLQGIIKIQKEQLIIRDKMRKRQSRTKYLTAALGVALGILISK